MIGRSRTTVLAKAQFFCFSTAWFGTKDSRDEQQWSKAVPVQGNWVQLRIPCSPAMYHAVFTSAVVLPQFRMAYNLRLRVNDHKPILSGLSLQISRSERLTLSRDLAHERAPSQARLQTKSEVVARCKGKILGL